MAVTIEQTPAAYSPSDNPLRYVFSSNQTGQSNFSFIVRTYMDGILVSTDEVFPQNGSRSFFDASKVAKYNLDTVIFRNGVSTISGTLKSLYITVTEKYGATPTEQTPEQSITTQTWKACLSDFDFVNIDFDNDWVDKRFLTNAPLSARQNPISILPEQDTALLMLNGSGTKTVEIVAFDSTGAVMAANTTTYTTLIRQFNLKRSLVRGFVGLSPAVEQDIKKVTIQVSDGIFDTELLTFNYFESECYEANSLVWMNEFGAFDSFIFEHNLKQSGDVERFGFTRKFGGWVANNYNYLQSKHQKNNYTTNQNDKGVIYTDYISEELQNFLIETYKSPIHYLFGSNGLIPIEITARSFEKYQDRFEELHSEEIAFNYSLSNKGITI